MNNGIESDNQKTVENIKDNNENLNIDTQIYCVEETEEEKTAISEDEEQGSSEFNKKEKFDFSEFLSFLYKNIYLLGLQTQQYIKRAFSFLGSKLSIPFLKLAVLFRLFVLIMDRLYFDSLRLFAKEWSLFRSDVRLAQKGILNSFKQSPLSVFSLMKHYIKKSFERHPLLFKRITSFALPILSAVVLIITVSHFSNVTLALNVNCNGQSLGYITDESVYTSAQELVKEKMESTKSTAKTSDLEEPKYKLAIVEPNELSDAQTISDRLIENSDSNITPACGVYINDEFICAIKNEMDATQVFNSIIDANKTDNSSDVVSFVQDVEYKQGLYPNDSATIWNTDELKAKLNTKKAAAVYYTIKQGDTVSGIAQEYGLKTSQLMAMNPGMTENIRYNDQIIVSTEVNYLQTKVVKTEVTTQTLPYDIVENQNSKLYKGTKKVVRQGSSGSAQVTSLVTYVDGAIVSSEEINRVITKQPVSQLVDVGSKSTSIKAAYGTYSVTTTGGGFVWPAIGLSQISSPYGRRWGSFHPGIDISGASASGHIVVAASSGTVISAGWDSGGYGNKVMISHGNGVVTLYGHMQSGSLGVSVGQSVSAGQALGRVGSTGYSTGPHLHFEVRVNGSTTNPLNYLR